MAAILCVACGGPTPTSRVRESIPLSQGWQYRWGDSPRGTDGSLEWLNAASRPGDWRPLDVRSYAPGRAGREYLWMRVRLPERRFPDPVVKTHLVLTQLEAFVDGRSVYRFGNLDPNQPLTVEPVRWHLLPVPADAGGRWLTLRIRSGYTQVGTQGTPVYGARADLLASVVRRDLDRAVVAGVMLLLGLLAIALGALGRERRAALSFGAYAVSTAIYSIYYTELKDLILDWPLLWVALWMNVLLFSLPALLIFIETSFGAGRWRLIRRLWQAHLVLGGSLWVYSLTLGQLSSHRLGGGMVEYGLLALCRLLVVVDILAVLHLLWVRGRGGDIDARILLLGLCALAATTLREVAAAFGLIEHEYDSQLHWGALALVVCLGLVVQRRYVQRIRGYARALDERAREKAVLLEDLHDGIGTITTNIRMTAQRGRRASSESDVDQALATIEELSRSGIEEIRAFLRSVDPDELGWRALVAEMRRQGVQLVEAAGLQGEVHTELQDEAAPPTGLLTHHVLRVYREALTNAVKHARGARVRIEIRVGRQDFELQIQNLGAPTGARRATEATGVNLGRGLTNMAARARSLGGQLDIDLDGDARVRLWVPIPDKPPASGMA